jgi:hypothetical protein
MRIWSDLPIRLTRPPSSRAGTNPRLSGSKPRARARIGISIVVGALTFALAYWHLSVQVPYYLAYDFTYPWRAAQALLAGRDPYAAVHFLKYPLPAALVALPFAPLSPAVAGASFASISSGLMIFALTRDDYHFLPIVASAPFLLSVRSIQWTPLLVAAALNSSLGFLLTAKPTIGLALLAWRPSKRAMAGALALILVSLAITPSWPTAWFHSVFDDPGVRHYRIPALVSLGPILLLAAMRLPRRDARLLLAMSLIPQVFTFYDQLPVMLVARTRKESFLLAACSLIGWAAWRSGWEISFLPRYTPPLAEHWVMLSVFLPALALVMLRPRNPAIGSHQNTETEGARDVDGGLQLARRSAWPAT